MTTIAAIPDAAAAAVAHKDVWSRSGTRYRVRAIVLLVVDVLLFVGLASFAYWLRSGEPFSLVMDGYWNELRLTFNFTGDMKVTLASFLVGPMSADDVPMLIPVLGMLMAALVMIPILVAVLYRFWASLPFIAVVGFVGVMPWLAITLLLSCALASIRPFRLPWRFASALLGLLPIVVYLFLAARGSEAQVTDPANPLDKVKFVAPWAIALVSATLLAAVVLGIARLVDYRPGAIAPLLGVSFALPVALFELYVGRDELYYRLLEQNMHVFTDVSAAQVMQRRAEESWLDLPEPRPRFEEWNSIVEMIWQMELMSQEQTRARVSELTRYQQTIAAHCDWFVKYFPTSRYACNALYLKGRALSMRVDLGEFERTEWIRYYDDFPAQASWSAWRTIVENQPQSAVGRVAALRLAQLDARQGRVTEAVERLDDLTARLDELPASTGGAAAAPSSWAAMLERAPADSGLYVPLDRIRLEAHELRDLLAANKDPIYGYQPLVGAPHDDDSFALGLLHLVPRDGRYAKNLEALKRRYPGSVLTDNIDLELAKALPAGPERAALLESFVSRYAGDHADALPEGFYRLGTAYMEQGRRADADAQFKRLIQDYPASIWALQARRYAPALAPNAVAGAPAS